MKCIFLFSTHLRRTGFVLGNQTGCSINLPWLLCPTRAAPAASLRQNGIDFERKSRTRHDLLEINPLEAAKPQFTPLGCGCSIIAPVLSA